MLIINKKLPWLFATVRQGRPQGRCPMVLLTRHYGKTRKRSWLFATTTPTGTSDVRITITLEDGKIPWLLAISWTPTGTPDDLLPHTATKDYGSSPLDGRPQGRPTITAFVTAFRWKIPWLFATDGRLQRRPTNNHCPHISKKTTWLFATDGRLQRRSNDHRR